MKLEKMDEFFTARVNGYDEHMQKEVGGCAEGYEQLARLLPDDIKTLLDLGCGTGLELEPIYKRFPRLAVTGVDMTRAMLDALREKFAAHNPRLLCESYFDYEYPERAFDAVVSFQTMHHFKRDVKLALYKKLHRTLKSGGVYIEGDYMAPDDVTEAALFAENDRLRAEQGIPDGQFYHFDTPCTPAHQIETLENAGFTQVKAVWRFENTTIITAKA